MSRLYYRHPDKKSDCLAQPTNRGIGWSDLWDKFLRFIKFRKDVPEEVENSPLSFIEYGDEFIRRAQERNEEEVRKVAYVPVNESLMKYAQKLSERKAELYKEYKDNEKVNIALEAELKLLRKERDNEV